MGQNSPPPEKLYLSTKIAFGAGDLGPAITANILVFFLLYFFTQVAGLPPALAGSILMIGKVCDAVNDPLVGIWSDRTRSRWGRRLPWMLWGAVPFGILFFLQWLVPRFSADEALNDWLLFGYYVAIGILFNVCYTVVNLPYTALTPELTQDYNERTSLNSFRFGFSIGGSILSLILAGIIFSTFPDDPQTQYVVLAIACGSLAVFPVLWSGLRLQERGAIAILDLGQRRALAWGLWILTGIALVYGVGQSLGYGNPSTRVFQMTLSGITALLLGLAGYSFFQGHTEPYLKQSSSGAIAPESPSESIPFRQQLQIVFRNRPFLYVIGIYLASWLGVQLTASILPYFVVDWMGLPNTTFPKVALMVQGTALGMLFVWSRISQRFGKKTVYFWGTGLWILAQGGLFFLQPGQENLLYLLAIAAGFGVSVAYLVPWSMVPDVIELDELETGQRREGIFYGFMVLLQKMGLALGLFIVGLALDWANFVESVPGAPPPVQPDSALLAIRIAIGPLPTCSLILGLVLAYFYPITQAVHGEIRMKLRDRQQHPGENR